MWIGDSTVIYILSDRKVSIPQHQPGVQAPGKNERGYDMTKYLGKTRLYELVKDRVGASDRIMKASESFYEKDSYFEWLTVYGRNFDYKVFVACCGAYLIFSVFDKNYNCISREAINDYMIRSLDISI